MADVLVGLPGQCRTDVASVADMTWAHSSIGRAGSVEEAIAVAKQWTIDVHVDEDAEHRRTRAEALLHTNGDTQLRGEGTAWRNPRDREVPEIGDELAAARALIDLARKLERAAATDIVQSGRERSSHGW